MPSELSQCLAFSAIGSSHITQRSSSASPPTPSLATNSKSIVRYAPTTATFANPERGFHDNIDLLAARDLRYIKAKGYTLARAYIRLDEYRNRPLPEAFLTKLDRQFQLVRQAGIKIIPRFAYNLPTENYETALDNPLELTILHINQLKPLLKRNADVIAVFQAGFIGAWGEWHTSSNGLDRPVPKATVLKALLGSLPSNRMVQIRFVNDIKTNFPQPLTLNTAFRGEAQSRVAFHNDCFLANRNDVGTYEPDLQLTRNYLGQIAPYIAVGGETCQVNASGQRSDCPTAESELAEFHWSYLNPYFYKPTISRWRREGCYDRIEQKLGYRLQLVRSDFPATIGQSRQLQGNFVIKNVGYASPFNPRGLELILRDRNTSKIHRLSLLKPLSHSNDPRFWQPQFGAIYVPINIKLPATLPAGSYEILVNLPDPMPKLANRPEYSIRLANEQTWEAKTGFNSLKRTIQLTR